MSQRIHSGGIKLQTLNNISSLINHSLWLFFKGPLLPLDDPTAKSTTLGSSGTVVSENFGDPQGNANPSFQEIVTPHSPAHWDQNYMIVAAPDDVSPAPGQRSIDGKYALQAAWNRVSFAVPREEVVS